MRVVRLDGQRDTSKRYQVAKFTTRELMKAERDILKISLERRYETRLQVDAKHISAALERTSQAKGYSLNAEQAAAVQKLAGEAGGVKVMVGDAGTGKSSTLFAVREAHEAAGLRVLGTSTGGKASAELMASSGIDSRNLAKLSADLASGREHLDGRTVLVIDEAGMTASRELANVMRRADEAGAKVILVGDWKQLQPVGAGETFRALDKELGSARLEQINRQAQEWERGAVKELSRGEAAQALRTYGEQGRVHIEGTYKSAIKDVAERHTANMREVGADKAVALAATNKAVDDINREVRAELKKDDQLKEGHTFTTQDERRNSGTREIDLAKGDRVMLVTSDAAKGYANGDAGTVLSIDAKAGTIEVKLDRTGETVQLRPQETEIRHGYAMTTHKAQGSTYDRATVYLDKNTSREMAYVQASRAKESTDFVATRHTVKEMRQDAPAPEALQKAVEATAAAREAAGKGRDLEPGTKESMQAAVDYIKANKEHAPKEALREVQQQDAKATPELQRAVEATAAAREAAGKGRDLEPGTKENASEALKYIEANKEHISKEVLMEARKEARDASTIQALAKAMSRERPKETTLDYKERGGPGDGRERQGLVSDRGRNEQSDEQRFREALGKAGQAIERAGLDQFRREQAAHEGRTMER